MSSEDELRSRRDRTYSHVEYSCDNCGLSIQGHSGDPQEAPWLYCPNCDEEMDLGVER